MNAYEIADMVEKEKYHTDLNRFTIALLIRGLAKENKMLKDFAIPILVHGGDGVGDWDGYELQELASKSGLFVSKIMTEPCNLGNEETQGCLCRDYCYGDESWECYRIAQFLLEEDKK